jgi:predicted AAA+ superfamily ATPase
MLGQNPWSGDGIVPVNPPFRRALQGLLLRELLHPSLNRFEIILGPRRVGKTTLMYQLVADLISNGVSAERIWWFRLDHPMLMDITLDKFMRFAIKMTTSSPSQEIAPQSPVFVFLDEILYARDWSAWLKTFYDDHWPIRVVATGSATAALRQEHRETGVGRWRESFLSPLLFHDFLRIQDIEIDSYKDDLDWLEAWQFPKCKRNRTELMEALQQYVMVGGFPELAKDAGISRSEAMIYRSQEVLLADAILRSLYKDLTQAYDIQNPLALEKLLYALAGQVGGILRSENLASIAGVSQPTIDLYLKYLEEAGLITMLRNYASSEETVQRRGRKAYFTDSALRNAALQRGIAPLHDPAETGILYENAVASHLDAYCRARRHRLYHWRDGKYEVDFVVGHPTKPVAIEVTGGRRHTMSGLEMLLSRYKSFGERAWLIGATTEPQDPSELPGRVRPGKAPLAEWLLNCGLATDAALLAQ